MDCKQEIAIRSLVRIECLFLQGFLRGVGLFIAIIISIPLAIPYLTYLDFKNSSTKVWKRIIRIPLSIFMSTMIAFYAPIGNLLMAIKETYVICISEWKNRWMCGHPKKPNGKPLPIQTEEEKALIDRAVTMSVVEDYAFT